MYHKDIPYLLFVQIPAIFVIEDFVGQYLSAFQWNWCKIGALRAKRCALLNMSTRKNKNPCIHRSFRRSFINVKSLLWLHVTCQYITVFCLRLRFTVISQLYSLCTDLVEVVKRIVKKLKFLGTSRGPRYSKSVKYWTRVYSHVLYWSRGVKICCKVPPLFEVVWKMATPSTVST